MSNSTEQTNDTTPIATDNRVSGLQPSGRTYTTYVRRATIEPTASSGARRDYPDNSGFDPSIAFRRAVGVVALAAMVGCGTTSSDRAISGAGIGAGAGAAIGAMTGMGPGTGAAIGAAAGAATGGLTKKKQIDLGEPVWKR